MKFLMKFGGALKRLMVLGVFLGACNAGFKAAHEYWEQHMPEEKKTESEPIQDNA